MTLAMGHLLLVCELAEHAVVVAGVVGGCDDVAQGRAESLKLIGTTTLENLAEHAPHCIVLRATVARERNRDARDRAFVHVHVLKHLDARAQATHEGRPPAGRGCESCRRCGIGLYTVSSHKFTSCVDCG